MERVKTIKVSVCITILNETLETIKNLQDSLKEQTLKPDEVIIIEAKEYDNCSRSRGRNIAIKKAKNEIVALTDAGCTPHKNWLKNITKPFKNKDIDVVAGGYNMVFKNNFQKAESIFLGTRQIGIKENFMPSARSMALTKSIWKKAGGFPEELGNTAEDTVFNIKLLKIGAKFAVSKDAVVDWYMPETLNDFAKKIYNYAKGDAESGIWWHPIKKFKTHNIKVLTIFGRYVLFATYPWLLVFYLFYCFVKAGFWGIILQITSDFACIIGFSHGILQTSSKRT